MAAVLDAPLKYAALDAHSSPSVPARLATPRLHVPEIQKGDTDGPQEYDVWVALPRRSHVPIRATLTVLMVGVVVLEGILAKYGMAAPDAVLLALIPLVGGAVYGDTVRPSGMAPASKAKSLPD
jgi:hypothetical protein